MKTKHFLAATFLALNILLSAQETTVTINDANKNLAHFSINGLYYKFNITADTAYFHKEKWIIDESGYVAYAAYYVYLYNASRNTYTDEIIKADTALCILFDHESIKQKPFLITNVKWDMSTHKIIHADTLGILFDHNINKEDKDSDGYYCWWDWDIGNYISLYNADTLGVSVTCRNGLHYGNELYPDFTNNYLEESIIIPSMVPYNNKEYPVVGIVDAAFHSCRNLKRIVLPNSITEIEGISDYRIQYGYYGVFANCSKLSEVVLPNNLEKISMCLFERCINLQEIKIPNSVKNIDSYAFYGCSNLISINIPNSVTYIGEYAFSDCGSLKQILLPNGIKYIEKGTFRNCPNITKLTLHNTLKKIGVSAFKNCIGITNLIIPNNVDSIEDYAFSGLVDLETLTLGRSINHLGTDAFGDCKQLLDIYIFAEKIPEIEYCDASDCHKDPFKNVSRGAYLWVPENRFRNYKIDSFWGEFDVQPMGAESANTDKVVITPDYNTASVVWPQVSNVDSYELVIKDKSGNEVCTLVFNGDGQLQSIAFRAPAANPNDANRAPQQTQATGFRFTVTGLESGCTYNYTITAKDAAGKVLQTYTGSFTTLGATGVEDVETSGDMSLRHARKIYKDGNVLILTPDGRRFNLQGAEVK